jgi:hypothetical protein
MPVDIVTLRIQLLYWSAIKASPAASNVICCGLNCAVVAGTFSPLYDDSPTPAKVESKPVFASTFLTRLVASAMYKFPTLSNATLIGLERSVSVAGVFSDW